MAQAACPWVQQLKLSLPHAKAAKGRKGFFYCCSSLSEKSVSTGISFFLGVLGVRRIKICLNGSGLKFTGAQPVPYHFAPRTAKKVVAAAIATSTATAPQNPALAAPMANSSNAPNQTPSG